MREGRGEGQMETRSVSEGHSLLLPRNRHRSQFKRHRGGEGARRADEGPKGSSKHHSPSPLSHHVPSDEQTRTVGEGRGEGQMETRSVSEGHSLLLPRNRHRSQFKRHRGGEGARRADEGPKGSSKHHSAPPLSHHVPSDEQTRNVGEGRGEGQNKTRHVSEESRLPAPLATRNSPLPPPK